MSSTVIGVTLSTTASFMNALGLNLQTLSANPAARAPGMLNLLGITFSTACGLVDIASYGFAPQSTLAPLGAATLVFNLLLAPVIHGKALSCQDALYTLLIVAGVVVCIVSGGDGGGDSVTPQKYTHDELWALAAAPAFQVLAACASGLFVGLLLHLRQGEASGRGAHLSTGFVYPVCAGMLGGCTVLSAKLLTLALDALEYNGLLFTQTVVPLVFLVAVCAGGQIYVNNVGLGKHDPLVMVPIYSSTFVLSNAFAGLVFFKEYENLSGAQMLGYSAGCATVVTGVLLIAASAQSASARGKAKEAEGKKD